METACFSKTLVSSIHLSPDSITTQKANTNKADPSLQAVQLLDQVNMPFGKHVL
jgi:hypothetical protein